MRYDTWIFRQEEPEQEQRKSYPKRETPTWKLKLDFENEMKKKLGAEEYYKQVKQFNDSTSSNS